MGAYFAQTFDQIMSKITKSMSKKSRNVIFPEKKAPAGGRTTDMGILYIKSKIPKKYKILKSKIQHQKLKIHHETPTIQHPKSTNRFVQKNVKQYKSLKSEIRYFRRYSHAF